MIKKFGRKQDENIVASDSDLDAKLELLKSIQATCRDLARLLTRYQETICYLSQAENEMGRFLKRYSMEDKTQAGKIMSAAGKSLSHSAQQRLQLRTPLDRVLQEVKTFRQRAIADTIGTLKRMEAARTEYRGALLWMKNVSEELDPDTYKQLEKFRCVQAQVRKTKSTFDRLKIDSMQKIDLLSASRCNMLSHALVGYQNSMLTFLEKTSGTMVAVAERFKGYQYYEFSVLKELRPESKRLAGVDDGDSVVDDSIQSSRNQDVQLTQKEGPTEEELDRRLDEIFQADNFDDAKLEDIGLFGSDTTESLAHGSRELISRSVGGVPEEHRDFLTDLFSTEDNVLPSLSSEFGISSTKTEVQPAGPQTVGASEFKAEWKSVFAFNSEPAQPTQSGFSEDDPWSEFQRSVSSTLPSHLLDKREDGAGSVFGSTASSNMPQHEAGSSATPSEHAVMQSERSKQPSSLDSWMRLFSDLGQLGNPDAISKKEGQISDA
ncbi:Islet cell autoantigen 1 [Clonorchis sinensis]|uniref:Islet cell autoantigen 1 n=1 Tax=Clonorchis sinensis TaxID=79923 RepID=A0A8T1LTX5_CLOSI|nr:Islet cell autoantigen 1 [Clonorchis sinensis]